MPPAAPSPSSAADRLALRLLIAGALAVVLAALPYKLFELDRFFVPKEIVLALTAGLGAIVALARRAPARESARPAAAPPDGVALVDLALVVALVAGGASALLAGDRWYAARALAIAAGGTALFWVARRLARAGLADRLLAGMAAALVLAAATALAQAYGVESTWFSINRAPGGTFGNRNFVAHLAAIGLPLLVLLLLRARRRDGALVAGAGAVTLAAVLVLTRSRGAWLGAAAALVPLAAGALRARTLPGARPTTARLLLLPATLLLGAGAALALPNTLDWRSDSPYLDSVKGVVDYRQGSGRGRLQQYANSVRLLARDPILGVGPGNWAARYPAIAPAGDPSLAADGTTANPWPSSDWVAFLAERGVLGLAALGAAVATLAWWAHRAAWRGADADRALLGSAFGAVLAATLVVGLVDAVLLLPAPAFLAWTTLGALAGASGSEAGALRPLAVPRRARRLAALALGLALLGGAARGVAQGRAMALFGTGRAADLAAAARLDPGSYRIRLRAAELAARAGRCTAVREHAGAAAALLPEAAAPRRLLARCQAGRRRRG